jgi:hypothetical protein
LSHVLMSYLEGPGEVLPAPRRAGKVEPKTADGD